MSTTNNNIAVAGDDAYHSRAWAASGCSDATGDIVW